MEDAGIVQLDNAAFEKAILSEVEVSTITSDWVEGEVIVNSGLSKIEALSLAGIDNLIMTYGHERAHVSNIVNGIEENLDPKIPHHDANKAGYELLLDFKRWQNGQ